MGFEEKKYKISLPGYSIDDELMQLFDLSMNPLCIADIEGTILKINKTFADLLGYTFAEMVGQNIFSFIHPSDQAKTTQIIVDCIARKVPIIDFENRYIHKDGTYRWFSWSTKPDFEKEISYSLVHDITQFKIQEDKLDKAERIARQRENNRARYMSYISNRLLNPLQGLLGFSDLLKDEGFETSNSKEYLNQIIKNAENLARIANEIREISKIDAEDIVIRNEWVYPNLLLEELYSTFNSQINNPSLKLVLEKDKTSNDYYFHSDKDKLSQILSILLTKAIESTYEGTVRFGFERKATVIRFFVNDTGKGLDEAGQKAILKGISYQEEIDNEDVNLALKIANSYVGKIGGTIKVNSKPGFGTRFTVTLPLAKIQTSI